MFTAHCPRCGQIDFDDYEIIHVWQESDQFSSLIERITHVRCLKCRVVDVCKPKRYPREWYDDESLAALIKKGQKSLKEFYAPKQLSLRLFESQNG